MLQELKGLVSRHLRNAVLRNAVLGPELGSQEFERAIQSDFHVSGEDFSRVCETVQRFAAGGDSNPQAYANIRDIIKVFSEMATAEEVNALSRIALKSAPEGSQLKANLQTAFTPPKPANGPKLRAA